jgi:hypothetical protein
VVVGSPRTLTLLGPAPTGARPGTIAMSGITLAGAIRLAGGDLDFTLLDATLYPEAMSPAVAAAPPPPPPPPPSAPSSPAPPPDPTPAPSPPLFGTATLRMERCLLGAIDLSRVTGRIEIGSSVVSALPAPDPGLNVLRLPDGVTAKLTRLTVIGKAEIIGPLFAADSLFDGTLVCSRKATLTDCYVTDLQYPGAATNGEDGTPPSAAVSRCGNCGKIRAVRLRHCLLREVTFSSHNFCSCENPSDGPVRDCATCSDPACAETCLLREQHQSWEAVGIQPQFVEPNLYPLPDFARLSGPPAILAAASNRDVLGSYNLAVPTTRLNEFEAALKTGLLMGTTIDPRFED